jgi:4-diphosphocytidyl-2-C-methyl-D-erythritol kinase
VTDPSRRLAPAVRLAPAKINLTLAVLGARPDGFHDLHSVVAPLALADRLSVAVRAAGTDSVAVTGFDAGPAADNLVLRGIAATRHAVRGTWPGAPAAPPPLAARLEKLIPVAAGLGGGSSDAAAAIDAALEAWGAELEVEPRSRVAASLGSDVPLFLAGGMALIEGRGERVTPLPAVRGDPPGVLLVTPGVAVSTATAFTLFAAGGGIGSGSTRLSSEHLASELRNGLSGPDLVVRAGVLASANDLALAAAAIAPGLVQFRRALTRLVRRPIGLSGSGPTLWVLYPSLAAAEEAAAVVLAAIASGDVPGIGTEPPFVAATTIAAGRADTPEPGEEEPATAHTAH